MQIRKILIGGAVLIIGLPLAFAVITGASFYALVSAFAPNRTNGSMLSSGAKREYLLYVPPTYDASKPTPLVVSMHAAMNWPAFQEKLSQWNKLADTEGFIVVYPAGTGTGFRTWFMEGSRTPSRMPDVRFISDLIDTLQAKYNIDPARIYANGMSNGGGMTFALSCTLSHRIAAIGAVSAAQSLPWTWCTDSTPMPMIEFHGTADPFVPINGAPPGWLNPRPFPNVTTWAATWARRNHCASQPLDSAVSVRVTRREYEKCAGNATVTLYTLKGGGHQWPGGKPLPEWLVGASSREIDATALMWQFFRAHPLSRNSTSGEAGLRLAVQ